jgi:hypothetical protein
VHRHCRVLPAGNLACDDPDETGRGCPDAAVDLWFLDSGNLKAACARHPASGAGANITLDNLALNRIECLRAMADREQRLGVEFVGALDAWLGDEGWEALAIRAKRLQG